MAQSTPTNSYCSRASSRCAYMHHIEKYVFQQESAAPGLVLLLAIILFQGVRFQLWKRSPPTEISAVFGKKIGPRPPGEVAGFARGTRQFVRS